MRPAIALLRHVVKSAALLAAVGAALPAQSVLDRSPNLSGDWIGLPGTLYFTFVHRFTASAAPERKVTNTPTFVFAAPLTSLALIGATYGTNSTLASRFPNEHEYFARLAPLRQRDGAPVDAGVQLAFNDAARGTDAELGVGRSFGPLRVLGAGRALRRPDAAGYRYAVAGASVLRIGSYIALSGDVGTATQRTEGERVAWSGALQLQLPLTPHTLSIQATNVGTTTLQGSARGDKEVRYGFEFTIPLTLRRYLHRKTAPSPDSTVAHQYASAGGQIVHVRIQGLAFRMSGSAITAGATVEWTNDDPVAHTVTATDGSFQSPLIEPGRSWRYTFAKPGTYTFSCTPHPFMRGVIVVS